MPLNVENIPALVAHLIEVIGNRPRISPVVHTSRHYVGPMTGQSTGDAGDVDFGRTNPYAPTPWHEFYAAGSGTESGVATGDYCDGANLTFDLVDGDGTPVTPVDGSLLITLRGSVLVRTIHYNVSGNTITFTTAPPATAWISGHCAVNQEG